MRNTTFLGKKSVLDSAHRTLDDVALDGEGLCDVHSGRVLDVELVGGARLRLTQHLRKDARRLKSAPISGVD